MCRCVSPPRAALGHAALKPRRQRPVACEGTGIHPSTPQGCLGDRRLLPLLAAVLAFEQLPVAQALTSGSFFVGGRGLFPGRLRAPIGITQAPGGGLVIADTDNHRVQQCSPLGACSIIAGNSTPGSAPNQLHFPYGAAAASDGSLFVVDTFNDRVMRWAAGALEGVVVMANNFTDINGVQLGGPSELSYPVAASFDEERGHLYIVDNGQHRVRRYHVDLVSMNITSPGVTVAGTDGEAGSNLTHLDNPVAMVFEAQTRSIWIADSRNFRVVRWAENATSGTLELGDLLGKPYGISLTERAMYVADSGACQIVKKLWDNTRVVVAGASGCGSLDNQLRFPSGLFVDTDGTIYISDTQNDRVMRWFPTPRQLGDVLCYFNSHCSVVLRDGEPTTGNRLVIVNRSVDTSIPDCGGPCSDPRLSGTNWSSVAVPEGDWISDMTYTFGTPSIGDYGQYWLCWGAAPNMADVLGGNCAGVPHAMGIITVFPNVYPDENATRNTSQCVKGGRCFVDIWGYAFPEGTVENPNIVKSKGTEVLTPPDSAPGNNVICGSDYSANFVGYRDFVSVNPAQTIVFRRPWGDTGNLTSIATVDFNLALTIGRQSLCVCYNGNRCYAPWLYGSYGGTMLTRGSIGGETWVCRLNENCTVQIQGQFQWDTDRVGLVSWEADCTNLLASNISDVTSVVRPAEAVSNDESLAIVEFGLISRDGRYKVCYCSTYDDPRDDDNIRCNSALEYTQDAGALSIVRVRPVVYECPVSRPCVVTVFGTDLASSHRLLVGDGDPEVCGFAGVVEYSLIYGVEIRSNYFGPLAGGSEGQQTFQLDTFQAASPKSACYCPDYDQQVPFILPPPFRRLADGTCNDPIEFYQPIGRIVTRGPAATQPGCIMDRVCNVSIPGIDLSLDDRLQVCPRGHSCGEAAVCASAGPDAVTGLVGPTDAEPGESTFALGALPLGLYELCYCAPGDPSSPSAFPCDNPSDLTMQAVLLRVRGVAPQQRLSCVVDHPCTIAVEGLDLSSSDKLQVAPLESTCSSARPAEPGLFIPSAYVNGTEPANSAAIGDGLTQAFFFNLTTLVGRYRMCYCVEGACLNDQDFYLDPGVLFVKGLLERFHAARCTLGTDCSFEVKGIGLVQDSDTVQIVPTYLGCGGAQVIVTGDPNAQVLNGIYDKGPGVFENRPWYQGRRGSQFLFYDFFSFRWVLGPERSTTVPNAAGWAWVEDLFVQDSTPDRVQDPWRVWGPEATWVEETRLKVGRVSVPPDEIEVNPSNVTDERVTDPFVGLPFLISERFQLGRVNRLASYLICYCPSLDGPDNGGRTCSGDDEFLVPNGMLVVEVVRGNERHHCEHHRPCTVRTVLPELVRDMLMLVLLLPSEQRCNEGPFNTTAAWPNATNVSGALLGSEGTFPLGIATVAGSFQICLCTAYDDRVDGIPCSEPHEFFQQIGTLTVMPAVRLSYEFGQEATLNLTRGLGLNATDTLRLVPGSSCLPPMDVILSLRPDAASGLGEWASYVFGRPGTTLAPGYYSACLCSSWDSGDAGELACDESSEFETKVAIVTVNVVTSPQLTSTVTSAVDLEVQWESELESGRRLAAMEGEGGLGVPEGLLGFELASSVASSMQAAMASLLGSNAGALSVPPELVDFLPGNLSASSTLRVDTGFTALLTGTLEQHLQLLVPANVSCRESLLNPPWNNTGNAPRPSQGELEECLRLGHLVDTGSGAFIAEANVHLGLVTVPGIVSVQVRRFLHADLAPSLAWEPHPSPCVQGVPCGVLISSKEQLLSGGGLLVLEDEASVCGALPPPMGAANASQRAAPGFAQGNPVELPALSPLVTSQQVALGSPALSGVFALCYCWPSLARPQEAPCALDRDFFQRAGTLTVRGTSADLEFACVSFTPCAFTVEGTGLTAWDGLMVVPWADHCGFSALALDRIEQNPAFPAKVVGVTNGTSFRDYALGTVTRIGKYRICYCASYALSAQSTNSPAMGPCAFAGDYTMTGGILWVRGVDSRSFRFSCAKDDIDTDPCRLVLAGQGLQPGRDSLLLVPLDGAPCGNVSGELADVFVPNPVRLELDVPSPRSEVEVPWYNHTSATAIGRWRVRTKRLGSYRVCFCPSGGLGGSCAVNADFFQPAGVLTVRGAVGNEVFICRANDLCFIRIHGQGLSLRDKVRLIHGDYFCDWVGEGSPLVELNPAPAVEVEEGLTEAEFALGTVQPVSPRVFSAEPVTLRICYCASYSLSGDGPPCSNGNDFTHSAGIINTVVCPAPPAMVHFNPPVRDVYGDLGDPHVQLFSIPEHACEDERSRTLEDLRNFSLQLSSRGQTVFNDSRLVLSRDGQCEPHLPAGVPVMNMMASRSTEITMLGATWNSGSMPRGGGIRLRLPHHLHGVSRVMDTRGQGHVCPNWEVHIVPLACDAPAAALFGLLLHATILLASAIFIVSSEFGHILRFLKALRRRTWGLAEESSTPSEISSSSVQHKASKMASATLPPSPRSAFAVSSRRPKLDTGQREEDEFRASSKLASVLSSGCLACCIGTLRAGVFAAHLASFAAIGQIPDVIIFVVVPSAIVGFLLLLQFATLSLALGVCSACRAILFRADVTSSKEPQKFEGGSFTFTLPPLLHSVAAVAKLHLDISLPVIAQRHHCELWRVAVFMLLVICVVQVIMPLFSLVFSFLSPRRDVPAAVIPLALTVFGTLAGDEDMLGPEPLGLETVHADNESDVGSVTSRSSKHSAWSLASAGTRGLRSLSEKLGLRSREGTRSKSPRSAFASSTPKGSKEAVVVAPSAIRPVSNVRSEEEIAARREQDRQRSLRKATKQALAERASRGTRSIRSRSVVQSVPEGGELGLEEEADEEEPEAAAAVCCSKWRCCRRCEPLRDAVATAIGRTWWVGLVLASPVAPALKEEVQRHRAVGLYAYFESAGLHIAAGASRTTVERLSGVSLAHMQGRWTMLYCVLGGLDLTAMHAFVAIAYSPRLSGVETAVLVVASLVGLFQASRPGTGQALLWLVELCVSGPWSSFLALAAFAAWRWTVSLPLSWGCPSFTWEFSAWLCSVLCLELPLFLLWRRYRTLPWGDMARRVQQWAVGLLCGCPRRLCRCLCCCCSSGKPGDGQLKVTDAGEDTSEMPVSLGDGKATKMAQGLPLTLPPKEFPEAEEVLAALRRLAETLPEGLRMVLVEEDGGDIRSLRAVIEGLFKLPPPKYDLGVRVKKLAGTDSLLHALALKLMDEDKHCRKAFNEVVRQMDEKLYRLRLAVDATTLASSIHFRMGTLENRAELAFQVLPDAPQIWVVHWATLLSLGRLPRWGESEYLLLAEEVGQEYLAEAILVPVIYKPRSKDHPDPYGVTCRQLVTFAKWYREKYGLNFEIFFWIDSCCFPEILDTEREVNQDGSKSTVSRGSSRKSAGSMPWSLPSSRASTKTARTDFSRGTRHSTASKLSRFSKSSRLSRLSGARPATIETTVRERGLKNLQAWLEDGVASEMHSVRSVRSSGSGFSINFRDRKSIIGGFSEGASSLVLRGRSSKKLKSATFTTLADLQRLKREKDHGKSTTSTQGKHTLEEHPLHRLGLETTTDVNIEMLQDGSDLVRLLVFAAADAVVLCEAHDLESSAWVRLGLALAYAFSPTGQFVYAVDRHLVHIPKARAGKGDGGGAETPEFIPRAPIPKLAPPVLGSSFPSMLALEDKSSSGEARDARTTGAAVAIVSATAGQADTCVWREMVPEFLDRVLLTREDSILNDPTEWGEVHVQGHGDDRARLLRLTALCLDRPAAHSVGGYRRPPLQFGSSVLHVLRLEGKDRALHQWRRALRTQRLARSLASPARSLAVTTAARQAPAKLLPDESSSSSGEEELEGTAGPGSPPGKEAETNTKFVYQPRVLDLPARTREAYYGDGSAARRKESTSQLPQLQLLLQPPQQSQTQAQSQGWSQSKTQAQAQQHPQLQPSPNSQPRRGKALIAADAAQLLRQAADLRSQEGAEDAAPKQMLHPLPSLKKLEEAQLAEELSFHPHFHSSNVLLGSACCTVEQFRARDTVTGRQQAGNPGMAVLAKALKVRGAVCPDKYKARGVSFDVKVEAVNTGWRDGLGIGFTAQNPDAWPADRLKPRHASQVPRSCTCGYSGRWMMGGRNELVHSLFPGQGAWEPGSVAAGDVVTAVLAAPPADVIRILVNGRLVAERPALGSGLPDPTQEPLWGIVELDGACAKVRLGAGDAPAFAADLTELATRTAGRRTS